MIFKKTVLPFKSSYRIMYHIPYNGLQTHASNLDFWTPIPAETTWYLNEIVLFLYFTC